MVCSSIPSPEKPLRPEPNPYLYAFDPKIPRAEVLAALAAMPAALRESVRGAGGQALVRRPSADAWSAFETVCHVRDATLAYAARFRWMIFDSDPFLPNYEENNWVAASMDTPEDIPQILDEVAASRSDLMRVLTRLPGEAWLRTGRHEIAGTIVLEHYARHKAVHEALHLEQIRATLGS